MKNFQREKMVRKKSFIVFGEYFGGKIEEINEEDLPEKVTEYFEKKKQFLLKKKDSKKRLKKVYKVKCEDGNEVYLGEDHKEIGNLEEGGLIEDNVYGALFNGEEVLCRAELVNCIAYPAADEKYFKDKPYLARLFSDDNKQQGFGTTMVLIMNAYSHSFLKLPLYVDTIQSSDADEFLEKLKQKGILEIVDEPYEEIENGKMVIKNRDRYKVRDDVKANKA